MDLHSTRDEAVPIGEVYADTAFERLRARSARVPFTWQEFLTQPLPTGVGAVEAYRILSEFNHASGVLFPSPSVAENGGWYQMTMQISQLTTELASAIAPGTLVFEVAVNSADAGFSTKIRVADAAAAARLDGLAITDEDVDDVAVSGRRPMTGGERLALNALAAERELPQLVEVPFSKAMLGGLAEALADGVDMRDVAAAPRYFGVTTKEDVGAFDAQAVLGNIVAYANDDVGDEFDPPLLRGMMLTDMMSAFKPLGELSSQVGRLMTKLYMLKHGMPVMAALPLSRARVDWEEGLVGPPDVLCTRSDLDETARYIPNKDCTLHQTVMLQLALLELQQTEELVALRRVSDEQIGAALREDPEINARQRTIIARALRNASAEFTIGYHQRNHSIAYATARADLLGLAERGFLEMEQRGKAFVFTPSASLRDKLPNPKQVD